MGGYVQDNSISVSHWTPGPWQPMQNLHSFGTQHQEGAPCRGALAPVADPNLGIWGSIGSVSIGHAWPALCLTDRRGIGITSLRTDARGLALSGWQRWGTAFSWIHQQAAPGERPLLATTAAVPPQIAPLSTIGPRRV